MPSSKHLKWYALVVPQAASLGSAFLIALAAVLVWRHEINFLARDYFAQSLLFDIADLILLATCLWFLGKATDLPARLTGMPRKQLVYVVLIAIGLVAITGIYELLAKQWLHVDLSTAARQLPFNPHQPNQWIVGFLTIVVIGPMAEEAYFRGIVMGWLASHWGKYPAIVLSSLVFAFAHCAFITSGGVAGWLITIELAGIGLVLAWVATYSGSLLASFTVHAINNLSTILAIHFLPT